MSLVSTKFGPIIGQKIAPKGLKNHLVNRYLGIPYAEPPVGRLRFRKTVPWTRTWSTTFEATTWPAQCPQFHQTPFYRASERFITNKNFDEDCLKLNIWSPESTSKTLKPVLVWIHGGGLVAGTSSFDLYDGEYICAKMDVVVVSFNYRLGTLGFFYSAAVPEVCGNQGLWDQVTALQWVNANIKNFGGDPSRVTIVGQSAGAWSVSLHVLSPVSRDLFSNAILMSGAAINAAVQPEVLMAHYCSGLNAVGLATETDTQITAEMIQKLEQMDAMEVAAIYYRMKRRNPMDRKALVIIDGEFLPAPVDQLLATGNYKRQLNLLSSIVEDEGSFFLGYLPYPIFKRENPAPVSYNEAITFLRSIITELKPFESLGVDSSAIDVNLVQKYYFRGLDPAGDEPDEYRKRIGIALGDFWLGCTTLNFAKQVFKNSNGQTKAYQWYYTAKSNSVHFLAPDWSGTVTHCDELFSLFGMSFRYEEEYEDRDRVISEDIVSFVGQFIRTGKPGPKWQSYYFTNNNNLIAPYYEINNQAATSEHFQYNCKHLESEAIWSKAVQKF